MDQTKLKKMFAKSIRPRIIFGSFNAILAICISLFFIGFGFSRCSTGEKIAQGYINIAPEALNEANLGTDPIKSKEIWNAAFTKYAYKIKITNANKTHRFKFRIKNWPVDNSYYGYGEIAFEVYNKDKDYLFTFTGDNYWNQKGYDDGYWHEYNLADKVHVKFPSNGDYYIFAGVPPGSYRSKIYNRLAQYSDGKVYYQLMSGDEPVSFMGVLIAFAFFLIAGIVLFTIRTGEYNKNFVVSAYFKFKEKDYIVKLPDTVSKELYTVAGYSKTKGVYNTIEVILNKDGVNTFLEVEREREENRTFFYCYHYDSFPENDFSKIPTDNYIQFLGKKFKRLKSTKVEVTHYYNNGLNETVVKNIINYGTANEQEYISFEYTDNPSEFDVSYGKEVKPVRFWEVKKNA